jgi:hypothetical protein
LVGRPLMPIVLRCLLPPLSWLCLSRLWCVAQSGCQLDCDHIRTGSPLWGLMWSTTVARVTLPLFWHMMQSGC